MGPHRKPGRSEGATVLPPPGLTGGTVPRHRAAVTQVRGAAGRTAEVGAGRTLLWFGAVFPKGLLGLSHVASTSREGEGALHPRAVDTALQPSRGTCGRDAPLSLGTGCKLPDTQTHGSPDLPEVQSDSWRPKEGSGLGTSGQWGREGMGTSRGHLAAQRPQSRGPDRRGCGQDDGLPRALGRCRQQ